MIQEIDDILIGKITQSFDRGKSIRRNLPGKGKIVIDQQLPFVCVYRFRDKADPFLAALLKTQGAYLIVPESVNVEGLLGKLMDSALSAFKSFMIVEIWNEENPDSESTFRLLYPEGKVLTSVSAMEKGFAELAHILPRIKVKSQGTLVRRPRDFPPLMNMGKIKESGALLIGIAIPPLFRDKEKVRTYPLFFRKIQREFAEIIKKGAFELVRDAEEGRFIHYLMMGKTRLDNLVRSADKRIAAIDEKMNFLLTITPVNAASEWKRFQENKFSKTPRFTYRLIPIDPELEKRKLFNIPLENIEHTTLAFLLRDKRLELEKQLLMLEARSSKKFFHLSQSIYGEISPEITSAATSILKNEMPEEQVEFENVNAIDFAHTADHELEKYRQGFPKLDLRVKVKENVTGLIVSGSELSVGKNLSISQARVNALIQHEIGTHILTYCNGHTQPLHLMYAGFAGYEQLQEGLAVLSEYLVGGLNINRLRLLAARVIAVHALTDGADFVECFHLLCEEYGFCGRSSFNITMRVFRSGGFTKDAIYLKGLLQVMNFVKSGGDITRLYAGKYALEHLPFIVELEHLGILRKSVLPAYLTGENARNKIKRIKDGIGLTGLVG